MKHIPLCDHCLLPLNEPVPTVRKFTSVSGQELIVEALIDAKTADGEEARFCRVCTGVIMQSWLTWEEVGRVA